MLPTPEIDEEHLLRKLGAKLRDLEIEHQYSSDEDITVNVHEVCYPLNDQKMNVSLQTDLFYVPSINDASDNGIPENSRYHDVLYRWDCVKLDTKKINATDRQKIASLVEKRWKENGIPDNWKQAKHVVIHHGLPDSRDYSPSVDIKNSCIRNPTSTRNRDQPKSKAPVEIWTTEPSNKALEKQVRELGEINNLMSLSSNPTLESLPPRLHGQLTENTPTSFKYPVIHFKLKRFNGALCQLGTASADSVTTQLYLPTDGCSHHKFAQPGTPARPVTQETLCELVQNLKCDASKMA